MNRKNIEDNKRATINFAIIQNNIEDSVPQLIENENKTGGYIDFGKDNKFPYHIFNCYQKNALMNSIIDTFVDYIMGDGIEVNNLPKYINRKNQTIEELIRMLAYDYCLYNCFAFQVIRNSLNAIVELNYVDIRHVRVNEAEDTIYYNNWETNKSRKNIISYPRYNMNSTVPNSIFWYKSPITKTHYPSPMYIGSLTSLYIMNEITNFHYSQVKSAFCPSAIVNFNNGTLAGNEELAEEIEAKFYEKFQGSGNAGRIVLSFNESQETATTIERLVDDNYDQKYSTLKDTITNDIYVGFRINPILLGGINQSTTGFNKQEFSEAFTLFSKTKIAPIQKIIQITINNIFGEDTIKFNPFIIDWGDKKESGMIPVQEEEINNTIKNI